MISTEFLWLLLIWAIVVDLILVYGVKIEPQKPESFSEWAARVR